MDKIDEKSLWSLEVSGPFDSNFDLVSFGPLFGKEALDAMTQRLISMGLTYFDDFFEFFGDYPEWCSFKVEKVKTASSPAGVSISRPGG